MKKQKQIRLWLYSPLLKKDTFICKVAEIFNKCSNGPIGPKTAKVQDSFECL
jgi:hypothetical protein